MLALSITAIALLLYAADWTKSAELSELPPIIAVLGNFHPILLHLPIGVFVYLGITEAWNFVALLLFKRGQIKGGLPILVFGAVSALIAAFAGLLLYLQGDYSGELIDQHMNWGTGFAASSLIVLCSALLFKENSQLYRVILFISIATLSIAAHQGGLITHGDPLEPLFAKEDVMEEVKPVQELIAYEIVDKIFQSKCYDCHAVGRKQKGGLIMDSYEALLAGGKKGNALVPASLTESKISTYAHLPLDDDLHMPPEGKPQLTEAEIKFIDAWILAGASPDGLLIDQGLTDEQLTWAVTYMGTPIEIEELVEIVDEPETIQVDFESLISEIEQYALNGVTRAGTYGDQLIFSAINARDAFDNDAAEKLIKAGPYLIEVDLSHTDVSSFLIQRLIEACPQLKRLNLTGKQVNKQSLESLVGRETLESLILFEAQLTPDALPVLRQLTQLNSLYLAGTGLEPAEIEQIRQVVPGVEVVADDFLTKHSPTPPEALDESKNLENEAEAKND